MKLLTQIIICTHRAAHNLYNQRCIHLESLGLTLEDLHVFDIHSNDLIGLRILANPLKVGRKGRMMNVG